MIASVNDPDTHHSGEGFLKRKLNLTTILQYQPQVLQSGGGEATHTLLYWINYGRRMDTAAAPLKTA
jgi:hypothetical protein